MQTHIAVGQIQQRLSGIAERYNRLLIVAGPSGSGKTSVLRALGAAEDVPVLNVGEEISRALLDLTERQRALQLPKLLDDAVTGLPRDLTLLDNIDLLFNPVLRQDPLRLLHGISRERTIVTSWLGSVEGDFLSYAVPEHPEFRRYPSADLLFVSLDSATRSQQVWK